MRRLARMLSEARKAHRERILVMNERNARLIEPLNPRRFRDQADDKVLAKEILQSAGIRTARTLAVVETHAEVRWFPDCLRRLDSFVIKPARGRAGLGIAVLRARGDGTWQGGSGSVWSASDIRMLMGNILFGAYAGRSHDRVLIEERIVSGPILGDLPVIGLPDVRVITYHEVPVMAMIRLPTRRSEGKANLHLGAVGLGIDLRSGMSTSATVCGHPTSVHVDSGQPLIGIRVSAWDQIILTARAAAAAFPLRYLGVDLCIPPSGMPLVLEVNVRPGLQIQNANRRGLKECLLAVAAGMPS